MEKKISIKKFVIVIAIILLSVFIKVSGLGSAYVTAFADEYGNFSGDYGMDEYEYLYKTGNIDVDKNQVKYIMINWINGKIDIESYDGDKIKIIESFANGNEDAATYDNKMRYRIDDNNQLKIQFTKSYSVFERVFTPLVIKDLRILLPKNNDNLELLDIKSGNSPITVNDIYLNCAKIVNRDGMITVNNCSGSVIGFGSKSGPITATNLDMESFGVTLDKGKAYISKARLNDLHFTSGKASCVAELENAPKSMQLISKTGDVTVYIPENDGFYVVCSFANDKFKCDFPLEKNGNKMAYGKPKFYFDYKFYITDGKASLLKAR